MTRLRMFPIILGLKKSLAICLLVVLFAGLILHLLLSFLTPAQAGTEGWEFLGSGPGGASILSIVVSPHVTSTVFAGTQSGIFKSTDGGSHWVDSTNDLLTDYGDVPSINTIVIHPVLSNTIYVGSSAGGGVFKSVNGGQNWSAINNGITTRYVQTIVMDTNNPAVLYAGTMGTDSQGGIFKSVDSGQSWTPANNGLPIPAYVHSIVIDPTNSDVLYAGSIGDGIYKSVNAGVNWVPINTGSFIKFNNILVIDPNNPSILYLGTTDNGLFKSENSGVTFTAIGQDINRPSIVSIWLADSYSIYVGTEDGGIFQSVDAGTQWGYSNDGCNSSYIQVITGVKDTSVRYTGTRGGVCKTINGGLNWVSANNGLPASQTEALILLPQQPITIYAGTAGGGLYAYQNDQWITNSDGISNTWIRSLAYDPITPTTLYAGTFLGGLYKSVDSGLHWIDHSAGLPSVGAKGSEIREIIVHPITSTIVYAGVPPLSSALPGGVFKSIDGGSNWTRTSDGMPYSYEDIQSLTLDKNNPEILYAGIIWHGVYKTTDGGQNWNASNNGLTSLIIRELAVDPQQSSIVYAGAEGTLFRSTDSGSTWKPTNLNLTVTSIVFNPIFTDTLYAGTEGWGVYVSEDSGINWKALTTIGFPNGRAYVYDVKLDPSTQKLYAATMNGTGVVHRTWNRPLDFSTIRHPDLNMFTLPHATQASPKSYGIYALCVSEACKADHVQRVFIPLINR